MSKILFAAKMLIALFFLYCQPAFAQGLADTFAGFSSNSDEPINIEADSLNVDDNKKIALFAGNVRVVQGDVTLLTEQLQVDYLADSEGGQDQQIKRLEATGGLVVTQAENTLTGDWAVFEMAEEMVTVGGGVVVSQGGNVLRGSKLIIDLKTGQTHMEADPGDGNGDGEGDGNGNSRVRGLFVPKNE